MATHEVVIHIEIVDNKGKVMDSNTRTDQLSLLQIREIKSAVRSINRQLEGVGRINLTITPISW